MKRHRIHFWMGRISKNSCFKTTTIITGQEIFQVVSGLQDWCGYLGNLLQKRLRPHVTTTGVWIYTKKASPALLLSTVSVKLIETMVSLHMHLILGFLIAILGQKPGLSQPVLALIPVACWKRKNFCFVETRVSLFGFANLPIYHPNEHHHFVPVQN